MRCSACSRLAVVDQPYRGSHLCGEHLTRSVEERFRRALHRQLPRFGRGTVAVALSGGKDSAVALRLTHRYLASRPGVRLVAISVDEGIEGYRSRTLTAATQLTRALGVEHRVVRVREAYGTTTDAAAARLPTTPPCSYCGVWRRSLLNETARSVPADALVLGFNLDDLAQTVLMNFARGDLGRIARMAPHRAQQEGMVPRVAPLADVPEREVYLYARLTGVPFDHAECPYAGRAARNRFREVVWQLEESMPGTRQALLRAQGEIAALIGVPTDGPARCPVCGAPSAGGPCRGCTFRRMVEPAVGTA